MKYTTDICPFEGPCDFRMGRNVCRALIDTYFPDRCTFRKVKGMPFDDYVRLKIEENYTDAAIMKLTGLTENELARFKDEDKVRQRRIQTGAGTRS